MQNDNDVATKADISRLEKSTKADSQSLKADFRDLKGDSKSLRHEVLKLEGRVEIVEEKLEVMDKKLDKIMDTMDKFIGRVDDLTVENHVGAHQTSELYVKVEDHEKRIKHIEIISHPA